MIVGAIVQARMGSTRLPGKVLAAIEGKPMISRVLERVQRIKDLDTVILAVPETGDNTVLARIGAQSGVCISLGSADDVLDRYYQTAKRYSLDVIMRITADCPLLDPEVSTQVLHRFLKSRCDYVSNIHPATFPDGLDTEVFTFAALERAWKLAKDQYEREHVTPYIWRWPSPFRVQNVWNSEDLSHHRWTVDVPEDLAFVREVYARMGETPFGMKEVLQLDIQRTLPRPAYLV